MRRGSGAPFLQWQTLLCAIQRLDLALFIHRKHNGGSRRIDVEADDIALLIDELGIVQKLELSDARWLKSMGAPDTLNQANREAGCLRHPRSCPVRRLPRRVIEHQSHDARGDFVAQRLDARRPCLITQQPFEALLGKALLPAPDAGLRFICLAYDLYNTKAIGCKQNDLGAPYLFL